MRRVTPSTAARWSAGTAVVGVRGDEDLERRAVFARRQEARSRLRGDRRVVTGRRWRRDLLARRRWLLGLGAAGSDPCREVHDLLVVLALLLVVACHDAQRTAQAQVNAATIARIERATADAVARVRRRGSRAGVLRTASIAALSSSAVASLRSQPRASGRRRTSPCPSAALPERT